MSSGSHCRGLSAHCVLGLWTGLLLLCISDAESDGFSRVFSPRGEAVILDPGVAVGSQAKISDVRWKHAKKYVVKFKTVVGVCQNRCELFPNGSLLINEGQRTDSGNYSVEMFGQDGKNILKMTMELNILESTGSAPPDAPLGADSVPKVWMVNGPTEAAAGSADLTPHTHSQPALQQPGGVYAPAVVVALLFILSTLVIIGIRTLRRRRHRSLDTDQVGNLYVEMRGNLQQPQKPSVDKEETYVSMQGTVCPPPLQQGASADTNIYESCRPGVAPGSSKRRKRSLDKAD